MKDTDYFCSVMTTETPYTISPEGINFREITAITAGEHFDRKTLSEMVKALNNSFQRGFHEGAQAAGDIKK